MVSVDFVSNISNRAQETATGFSGQPIHFRVLASRDITITDNVMTGASFGVYVDRQNVGVLVARNTITGAAATLRGVAVPGAATPPPTPGTKDLRIVDNVVSRIGVLPTVGIGISIAVNSGITDAVVAGNTSSFNSQSGLLITSANSQIEGNTAVGNGQFGVVGGPGSSGNTFEENTMLDNGVLDARELGANTWTENYCRTSNVAGICTAP